MLGFVNLALLDGERTEAILRAAVGLLGDLAEAFPNGQLRAQLQSEWVTNAVKTCRTRSQSAESKNVAKWAKEVRLDCLVWAASTLCADHHECLADDPPRKHGIKLLIPTITTPSFWLKAKLSSSLSLKACRFSSKAFTHPFPI